MNIKYLCTTIGNLTGIPIRLYEKNNLILYHSNTNLIKDPISIYLDKILTISNNVSYFITPTFYYYGIVNSNDYKIVLGPIRQLKQNDNELKELAFLLDIQSVDVDDFIIAMKNIISMSLDSILQILFAFNNILNNETLSLSDIYVVDEQQEQLKKIIETNNYEGSEARTFKDDHLANTFSLEQTLMSMVRHGDMTTLMNWISNAPAINPGILANEQLRQYKNTFIVSVTLACRNAIRGGMDIQDSLNLSDFYIQKCELLNNINDILNLQYSMIVEYTSIVERIRRGKQPTKLTMDVTNYVLHHLSEPIKTTDIANALFISRSRLSTKFKQETGINLNDYILKEKIIEAKRLLRYTDKSISAISSFLGFSSQSHFTRVFKHYIGVSPIEYKIKKQ